jgi:hypothetical protein
MVDRGSLADTAPAPEAHLNRERFYAHTARLARHADEQAALLAARKQAAKHPAARG